MPRQAVTPCSFGLVSAATDSQTRAACATHGPCHTQVRVTGCYRSLPVVTGRLLYDSPINCTDSAFFAVVQGRLGAGWDISRGSPSSHKTDAQLPRTGRRGAKGLQEARLASVLHASECACTLVQVGEKHSSLPTMARCGCEATRVWRLVGRTTEAVELAVGLQRMQLEPSALSSAT